MKLEQFVVPRLQVAGSSIPLNTDDGGRLFFKLIIGAIAIAVLVFLLLKLGVIQCQFFEERQVKDKRKFLQGFDSKVQDLETQL